MKTKKPSKFLPKTQPFDKKLEWAGYIVLIIFWGFSLYVFLVSSSDLPIHFDASGKPNSYGNKIAILVLPLVTTLLFIGMSWLNRYPEIFNYPIKITDSNKEAEYRAAMRTISGMKISVVLIFLLIALGIFITDTKDGSIVMSWLLPSIIILSFTPLIIYFSTAKKRNNP